MNEAIILANGSFPQREESLQALVHSECIVCCDGAFNKLVESKLITEQRRGVVHVVGDGDSLICVEPPFPVVVVDKYTDQDTNDLTKAVKYALSIGMERLVILGATGLREDHTLGNISLLAEYARMATNNGGMLKVEMWTDYGRFTPLFTCGEADIELESFARQQVSLFAMDCGIEVTSEGLKYPIEQRVFHALWEATLNEAEGDFFRLSLRGDGAVLVYRTWDAKYPLSESEKRR